MVYIPLHETWYCVECQEKDLIWYRSHGSEEDRRQHDYINWYYEQKERFLRKDFIILHYMIWLCKTPILKFSKLFTTKK